MEKPTIAQDAVNQAFEALGVKNYDREQVVFDALVKAWRKTKKRPDIAALSAQIGLSTSTTTRTLQKLLKSGRVLKPALGVWVPVVE